jgi:hypothetical protein
MLGSTDRMVRSGLRRTIGELTGMDSTKVEAFVEEVKRMPANW